MCLLKKQWGSTPRQIVHGYKDIACTSFPFSSCLVTPLPSFSLYTVTKLAFRLCIVWIKLGRALLHQVDSVYLWRSPLSGYWLVPCLLGIKNGLTPSLTEFSPEVLACALTIVGLLDMNPATAKAVNDLDAIGDARHFCETCKISWNRGVFGGWPTGFDVTGMGVQVIRLQWCPKLMWCWNLTY